jgi:hypothetical protein
MTIPIDDRKIWLRSEFLFIFMSFLHEVFNITQEDSLLGVRSTGKSNTSDHETTGSGVKDEGKESATSHIKENLIG